MKRVLTQAMQQAITANDIEAIKRCYRYGARVSAADVTHAIGRGDCQPATVAFLYKLGASPTVEHIAVAIRGDKPDLLKVVLDTLSNPAQFLNQLNSGMGTSSCTPSYLAAAAQRKQEKIVEMLLSYGASPTFPDSLGEPPIHYALLGGSTPVIDAIEVAVKAESEKNVPANEEARISQDCLADRLTQAVYYRDLPGVEAILDARPPLDASVGADYWYPIVGTAHPQVRPIARLLLSSGVSPFESSHRNPAAFTQAVALSDLEMFDQFLSTNISYLNHESVEYSKGREDQLEETPLGHILTQVGYNADKFVQYLLKKGAALDEVNALGDSAEAVAKRCGTDIAKRLLEEFSLTGRVPEFTVEFAPAYAAAQAVEAGDIPALRKMHESKAVDLAGVRIQRNADSYLESLLEFLTTTRLPVEKMREVASFLVSEVGLALNEEVWGFDQMNHALHGLFELGDVELFNIMLLAMTPAIREKAVVNGHLLFGAIGLANARLIRSLLAAGADPLQDWYGKPALQYLEANYRHLENYDELWTILNEATEAAKAAQAAQPVPSEEAVQG